nr:hypothetical protein [Tanacetum cinerariifolium]
NLSFKTFCDHSEETRSGNTTHADNSLPEYNSFCFEIEPDQERLIYLVKSNIPDDSSNDPLLEEVDLFLYDNSIPPEFLCIHDNVDDLIESALNFKLLLINSNSQRLDKKEEEVKNVTKQVALEDKRECDVPISENSSVCDNSDIFSDSKGDDDISVYDDFKDVEYVEASLSDPKIVSVEEENVVQQEEEEVDFESLNDNPTPDHSSDSNFEDNPSIPRPPPEPPDAETDAGEEIPVMINEKEEDVDYSSFIFVIYPEMFPLLLFAESENTIFDH